MEVSILDKMLDIKTREDFITYKQNSIGQDPGLLEHLVDYLRGEAFEADISRMLKGEYFFSPPNKILIKKKYSDAKRVVYQYKLHEKFLLMLMGHVLHDYDHIFSDNLYSFRRNRTAADLLSRIKRTKNIESMWVLKTDFKKFGESIDVNILISKLNEIFWQDKKFLNFISQLLLDTKYIWRGELKYDGLCLKAGSPLTNFFENVYAMHIDELMSKISNVYGRYGDDIVAFFDSLEDAENGKKILACEIEKIGLSFNLRKTYITAPGESVEVLGMKITGKQIDIADSSIEKIEYRFRKRAKKMLIRKRKYKLDSEETMSMFIKMINRRFFNFNEDKHELNWCRWAFPVITRDDSLREIDHILQDCIRYLGSGKKSDSRFRIRYEHMQNLGYHSLVHCYYHREKLIEYSAEQLLGVIDN